MDVPASKIKENGATTMEGKQSDACPLVSIITPFYNAKNFFEQTFKSVMSQTEPHWEWIIVDDCSTDGSLELAKQLAGDDKRIVFEKTQRNSGTSAARNIGLEKATGKYVLFLDSDDLLDQTFLSEQIAFIEANGPIVTASYRRKALNGFSDFIVPKFITYKSLLGGNAMSCLTTMYDRSLFGDQRFDTRMKKCEDYVFWLNILKKGYNAYGNTKVLATYVLHSDSKSSAKLKLIKYMFEVFHRTQGFGIVYSSFLVIRWAFYGLKKYKGVKVKK